jgi:hypothetical protein
LAFQLAGTDESLTAQGGLALFGEYLHGFGVGDLIDRELPAPGSAAGYSPSVHVLPLGPDARWRRTDIGGFACIAP